MDKKLLRERLEGYRAFNEWEEEEERRTLPLLSIEESVRQFLELQAFMRLLAPDAHEIFFEDDLAERVEARARFRRIAQAMKRRHMLCLPEV